jgi:hypothetical protein
VVDGVDGGSTTAVSDSSLALDWEADDRVGGALGGERESSLRRDCLNLGILVAFVLQSGQEEDWEDDRENPKPGAFSFAVMEMGIGMIEWQLSAEQKQTRGCSWKFLDNSVKKEAIHVTF